MTHRVTGKLGGPHPADGLTAEVQLDDGAVATIINPQSFAEGGPEWVMRYGDPMGIRYAVASLLETYDGLLSGEITTTDAIARLRLMRNARKHLTGNDQ